ncbi:hypothetical protein [Hymenobacter coccineus]|uniref:hypothetical protein n=1 Tax=Hymenobacter coccineus TaxID=1908235 RepID=UPI000ABF5A18|nr:hypothetical protein [Hymenobacter coccineus]
MARTTANGPFSLSGHAGAGTRASGKTWTKADLGHAGNGIGLVRVPGGGVAYATGMAKLAPPLGPQAATGPAASQLLPAPL